ncbi:MAG: prolyl oligopeptidase family serine peptidase [Bryobacterales bacterium]|nr:prolyl oligopeptidase family serine peptidase [Bryobacterales bacterium]
MQSRILTLAALAAGVLGILAVSCARKEPAPVARVPKQYTIEQFMKTVTVGGGDISHDNAAVLYTSDQSGVPNVYAIPFAGGEAKALTQSKDSTYAVSWFPADRRFLFTRDNGGDELNHLFVAEEGGAEKDLTPGEGHRASFYGWSKDRQYFYVATNERDKSFVDLYRYKVADLSREMWYRNPGGYQIERISPSGRWVVLNQPRTTSDNNIFLAETHASGAPKLITPHEGDASFSSSDFSPDEAAIFIETDAGREFQAIRRYEISSGEMTPVIEKTWDVIRYDFSDSGKYRVIATNEDADTVLTVEEAATGKPVPLKVDASLGTIAGINFSLDESRAVLSVSSDRSPRNLVAYDFASGKAMPLTRTLNPEVAAEDLVESKNARFKASDGTLIPGPLWVPHTATPESKAPALVWVHGGPGGQTRRGYSSAIQYLVNAGYVVYGINNRGSSGYGKTFFAADDQKHGKEPLLDCVEAKDFLAKMDFVDPKRIGIIGGSYGGYMTVAALAYHPEAFNVGVDIFGVTNWLRTLKSIPPWWEAQRQALYQELGNPDTQEALLREISPLFHAEKIKRPLLVLQGANDPRVLKVESDEIVAKVKANGVPVEYVVFDDEGHGFSKKANQIKAWEAIRVFLDKYLRGDGKTAVASR